MITADSSVWIAHFRGDDTAGTRALGALLDDGLHELVLLDLVLMEVLRGFRHDRDYRKARTSLAALPLETAGGESVAVRAAALYRDLRRQGTTVRSSVDLMVAAWCVENDCALLHANRDFEPVEGLHSWTA